MASEVSKEYAKGERVIATQPNIKIDDWRRAAVLADDTQVKIIKENGKFLISSSQAIKESWVLCESNIKELESTVWEDFDTYVKNGCGLFWTVELSKENWQTESKCTCPFFLKKFICKHIMMFALRAKICKLPRAAIPTVLGEKPKRGRKKQAKTALLTQ